MRGACLSAFAATALFAASLRAQPAPAAAPDPAAPQDTKAGVSPGSAAKENAAPPKAAEPVEVRVIGDKADALQKVPGSGALITKKEIERAEPYDTAEILRRVPGLNVRQEEGGGLRLDIGVRGLDPGRARRVLVLEDGIPIAVNPYAESDLYYAPPIERMRGVEVVKGSGSILFGPQTIGGVINFLTLAPPSERRIVADISGGTYGYFKGLASYGDSFGGARWLVQGSFKRGDGFTKEDFQAADAFAKIAFDTGERGQAAIKIGIHDEGAVSGDVGLPRDAFLKDPRRPTITPYDRVAVRRYEISLIHDQRLREGTDLRTLAYGYITTRLWNRQLWSRCGGPAWIDGSIPCVTPGGAVERIVGDPSLPRGAIAFHDTDSILDRTYEVAGFEPRLTHRFTTWGVGHTLDVGARVLGEGAQYLVRKGGTPGSTSGDLVSEERHSTIAFAAYAEDRIAFRDNLLVTPGVRFEFARFHDEILRDSNADIDPRVTKNARDTEVADLVPGIGAVYGSPAANVFAGLHLGWAPPRLTDSTNPFGHTNRLEPERAIIYELGTRLAFKKIARLEATGFLTSFQNQIVTTINRDTQRAELANGGPTRHYGVEAAATLRFGPALKLGFDIDLSARYTFSHATFLGGDKDGHLLSYAPEHVASAILDFEHAIGAGAEVAWTVVGPQLTDDENTVAENAPGNAGRMPAYHVLDFGVHYRHAPTGLRASVTIKNALDDVYLSARRPEGDHAAGFRQILAGLRWEPK